MDGTLKELFTHIFYAWTYSKRWVEDKHVLDTFRKHIHYTDRFRCSFWLLTVPALSDGTVPWNELKRPSTG